MKFCMCTTAKTLVGKCIRKFCLMLSKLVLQRKQITGGLVCVYVFSMDVYVIVFQVRQGCTSVRSNGK